MIRIILALCFLATNSSSAQTPPAKEFSAKLLEHGLSNNGAYAMLSELCAKAPHRLSGSEGAAKAIELTKQMMVDRGFANVHLETIMVPHWVRGEEEAFIVSDKSIKMKQTMQVQRLAVCALGGSIATPEKGIDAEVIEVKNFDQLKALGVKAKGKIIFFNRAFDPTKLNTFEAYGGAVDQRSRGAIEAAQVGAVGVLVRSMTHSTDDVPHTGAMHYADSVKQIPAAAIGVASANRLSDLLAKGNVRVLLRLTCKTLPDVASANVVGEITGTEKPKEIIVIGGHLDAWDKGHGAHDDGAGCVQAIEAVHLLKSLGVKPKRTIRAVMFINEENGNRGGKGYPVAAERKGETHIAAMESDRGGFAPRALSVQGDSILLQKAQRWKSIFKSFKVDDIVAGGSGVDVAPTVEKGAAGFGLVVEDQRYFDYHHSDNDTIDKVNPRELQLGAIVQAMLCWLISEEGL